MFTKVIKEKLKEKNLSIRALCRKIQLDASFFSKVLKGERKPPSDEKIIYKIAQVLELDPIKLLFYVGRIPE
ncbi:MAG: helix-turn-helix transcriptional regulator, partial [Elusimicrobiota bacterium]|nr:helix-turn-helix transcriptional regulator [Elusimicrobiota bacterium]